MLKKQGSNEKTPGKVSINLFSFMTILTAMAAFFKVLARRARLQLPFHYLMCFVLQVINIYMASQTAAQTCVLTELKYSISTANNDLKPLLCFLRSTFPS